MGTGIHFVDVGLGFVVFAAILWWVYTLTTKSNEQRRRELSTKRVAAHQPWDPDKTNGRSGNR